MQHFTNKASIPAHTNSTQTSNSYTFSPNIAGTAFSLGSSLKSFENVWILDTGAIIYMCCTLVHKHNVQKIATSFTVKFLNGEQSKVTHTSSVMLHPISLVITDVLQVPTFTFNLLSISKLSSHLNSRICF